ncbi:hypothetical protein ACMAZD_11715 [Vibrio sp. nBUS_14]|uniref:hypothetical protein n=1 Tax=Vibrio sp. nBUS_14 TaxID=3395321 RepID=UPI003EBDAA10
MNIINFLVLCFLFFGLAGFATKSTRWSWVDAVYYPLGAIGVCLVFIQSANYREIIELYDLEVKQRSELAKLERQRPEFSEFDNEDTLIETQGNHLAHISKYADACGDVIKSTECESAKKISSITKDYETKFVQLSGTERVQAVCSAAIPMIEKLGEADVLGVTLHESLLNYFSAGVEKGFYQYDYKGSTDYIDGFSNFARNNFSSLVNHKVFSGEEVALLSSEFEETLYFTKSLLSSLNVCLRAPETIRNGEYSDWSTKKHKNVLELTGLQERAESLSKDKEVKNNNVTKFQFLYWPFIIVFALSIKFGKAVNSLVPKKI